MQVTAGVVRNGYLPATSAANWFGTHPGQDSQGAFQDRRTGELSVGAGTAIHSQNKDALEAALPWLYLKGCFQRRNGSSALEVLGGTGCEQACRPALYPGLKAGLGTRLPATGTKGAWTKIAGSMSGQTVSTAA